MKYLKAFYTFLMVVLIYFFIGNNVFAHVVNGHAECPVTGFVPYGAVVNIYEVDPVFGGTFSIDPTPLATGQIDYLGNFSLTFAWPAAGTGYEAGGPDLIFQISQNIAGSSQIIYDEDPSQTHWNVPSGGTISFEITSPLSVLWNPDIDPADPLDDQPIDNHFVFTKIGKYRVSNMDCKGSDATAEGYLNPRKAPYSKTGTDTDMPFGSSLEMFGWFGSLTSGVVRYKVEYSSDGGSTWNDFQTTLTNEWYNTSDPNPLNWYWVPQTMGPHNEGGQTNLYKIPYVERPGTNWIDIDLIAIFNTKLTANGINRVKLSGFTESGGNYIPATSASLLVDPNYGEIVLQIDNTAPTLEILDLELNNVSKDVCSILDFGAGDNIDVEFRAYDQRGHLRSYTLEAMYGHNETVTPRPTSPNNASDNYNNNAASSPLWSGNLNYSTTYNGTTYTSASMPSCAYQFRLSLHKRTTNGYSLIYYREDTWHVTIQRY